MNLLKKMNNFSKKILLLSVLGIFILQIVAIIVIGVILAVHGALDSPAIPVTSDNVLGLQLIADLTYALQGLLITLLVVPAFIPIMFASYNRRKLKYGRARRFFLRTAWTLQILFSLAVISLYILYIFIQIDYSVIVNENGQWVINAALANPSAALTTIRENFGNIFGLTANDAILYDFSFFYGFVGAYALSGFIGFWVLVSLLHQWKKVQSVKLHGITNNIQTNKTLKSALTGISEKKLTVTKSPTLDNEIKKSPTVNKEKIPNEIPTTMTKKNITTTPSVNKGPSAPAKTKPSTPKKKKKTKKINLKNL